MEPPCHRVFQGYGKIAILEQTEIEIPEEFLSAAYEYQKNFSAFADEDDDEDLDDESEESDDEDPDYLDAMEARSFDRFVKTLKWRTILENIVEAQKIDVTINDLIQYEIDRMMEDEIMDTDLAREELEAIATDNLKDSTLRHRIALKLLMKKYLTGSCLK